MPPGRQAVVAPALALHADEVAPEIVGALEAQGLHPAEQISLCWLRRRQAESDAGNAIKLPPWYASRGAEIVAALTPLRRPPTRQSVAPPPATMQPQDSSLCGGCAIYSFSPLTATKAIMPARGDAKETKRS
jgi:hypothetical protein